MLLNSLVVFAPQRAFDERSDILLLPGHSKVSTMRWLLAGAPANLRAGRDDSDANRFPARMNEPETEAAILLGIDDPHIHDLAVDLAKPCVLINCRDEAMRLSSIAPDHRLIKPVCRAVSV